MQVARKIENGRVSGASGHRVRGGPVAALHAEIAQRLQAGAHARWQVSEPLLERIGRPRARTEGLALLGGLAIGAGVIALLLA